MSAPLRQCRFSFNLELVSVTHVGSGETGTLGKLCENSASRKKALKTVQQRNREPDPRPEEAQVMLLQRGADGLPLLPGTALKGAMRALARRAGLGPEVEECLFGASQVTTQDKAREGHMWLWPALAEPCSAPADSDLPFYDARACSFVLTGIRLDEQRMAVQHNFLYQVEMLPPGLRFRCRGLWMGDVDSFEVEVLPLLNLMASEEGFPLAAGSGYGFGRARLAGEKVELRELRYLPLPPWHEEWQKEVRVTPRMPDAAIDIRFDLTCAGPFIIVDPTRAGGAQEPDLRTLQLRNGKPVLTGKALLQALRRKVAWREALRQVEGVGCDYKGLKLDKPDELVKDRAEADKLSATQRLFGVTGWRKRLEVAGLSLHWDARKVHRSQGIQLDVFTQGPMEGALVDVECPADVTARVHLRLWPEKLRDEDVALLRETLEGLAEEGPGALQLGHGGGAGFGWFEVRNLQWEEHGEAA